MYDAVVAGAGPAGAAAAKALCEAGRRVLLVERFRLPRYKSCSGILIKKSLGLVKQYFGEEVPSAVCCAPVENRGMIFTDDKGREYAFRQEGRNVWRGAFDGWLVAKAAESGAELLDGTAAIACEEENGAVWVTLQNRERCKVRARYLLDCEGVTGALKRKLAPGPAQYITTFQTFNEGRIALDPALFLRLSSAGAFGVRRMVQCEGRLSGAGRVGAGCEAGGIFLSAFPFLHGGAARPVHRPGGKTREMADAPYSARLSHLLWTGTRFVRGRSGGVSEPDGRGCLGCAGERTSCSRRAYGALE